MKKGKLFKSGWENWLLKSNGETYPISLEHSFWLKIWGKEGEEMCYVLEGGYARLKASGPDTHEYTQD